MTLRSLSRSGRLVSRLSRCRSLCDQSSVKVTVPDRNRYLFGESEDGTLVSFESLGVSPSLVAALKACNKSEATAIQAAAFPGIASGRDVVIGAETGSGKTLAYAVPLIHRLLSGEARTSSQHPVAVVMVPNKDLCGQVIWMIHEVLSQLYKQEVDRQITCEAVTLVDGHWPYASSSLEAPDILVCTPALLASFVRGPRILEPRLFDSLRYLVLDEADMLLEGSFRRDVDRILEALKVTHRRAIREGRVRVHEPTVQFVLSAATLPSQGSLSVERSIASFFPRALRVTSDHLHRHHPRIAQKFLKIEPEDVVETVINALQETEPTMIFANTAEDAVALAGALRDAGVNCGEFHKLAHREKRRADLQNFREGDVSVLVCTDAASRGLDLPSVRHVIQAQFALNVVQHMHRVGRASRAGIEGRATNIYDDSSSELVASILRDTGSGSVEQSFSRRRGFRRALKRKENMECTEDSDSTADVNEESMSDSSRVS
mmetsp:Transcript_10404/g.15822  ORF Transcript_10404/g.15822 Transcript_10404/m.15822 type:complete len:490 (-) Transcript_10404:114-1583(-)